MSDLSSCYFCATALDAPLDRHTLAASGDDPTTVVLCPTCRRKLVGVLERVLVAAPGAESDTLVATAAAAVDDPTDDEPAIADVTPDQGVGAPLDVTDDAGADGVGGTGEDATSDDQQEGAQPPGAETDDATTWMPADSNDDGETRESDRRTAAAGDAEPIFAGGQTAAEGDDESVFGGDSEAAGQSEAGDTDGTATEDADGAAPDEPGTSDDEVVREAEPTRGDGEGSATGAVATAGGGSNRGAEDDGTGRPDDDPDTETYNRVIRLLQNREFPVQTGEIEEVAVNAYGMEPADFRAVIDAAVDRGVIDERGERLVRPN